MQTHTSNTPTRNQNIRNKTNTASEYDLTKLKANRNSENELIKSILRQIVSILIIVTTMRFTSRVTHHLSAVIPLKPDYESKDITKVKHEKDRTDDDGNRERTTVYIPMLRDMNTKFELLKFIEEFKIASKTLRWTDNAAKLYEKFGGQLESQHHSAWMELIAEDVLEAEAEPNTELFEQHVRRFVHSFFLDDDYSNQIEYLRGLKKTGSITPDELLRTLMN